MRAEVLAVGTELLLGDIVNSNAAYIGGELAAIGVDCLRHVTVGDNEERIAAAITEALARADAVIITGGLGPTQDDVTRESIARATGKSLRRSRSLEDGLRARFESLGRPMAEMNLRQADVVEGARVIEQTFGTAPGLIVEHGSGVIAAIPGVPGEMREMMQRAVLPMLRERAGGSSIVSHVIRTAGVSESRVAETLQPLWDQLDGSVTMAFLAGNGETRIRLTAKAEDAAAARAALADGESRVREALGSAVIGVGDVSLEGVVSDLVRARGASLATAESITAGALSARLVNVEGASAWFRGGITAYADGSKQGLLGVDDALLAEHGPVSEPVALAMAAAVRTACEAQIGVSVTGVAGPGPAYGLDPGTVVVAIDGPSGPVARSVRLPGDRPTIRRLAVTVALNLTRLYLVEELR